jgi:hypothetical protein
VISRLADCFDLDRKRVAIAAFVVPDDDVRCNLYWRNMEIGGKEFRVVLGGARCWHCPMATALAPSPAAIVTRLQYSPVPCRTAGARRRALRP